MRKLSVFNSVSLDGYFTDAKGDMSWAHKSDPEFDAFTSENAKGGGTLLFGRKTYEMMVSFWPTPAAMEQMPDVAKGMNSLEKIVFSRTLQGYLEQYQTREKWIGGGGEEAQKLKRRRHGDNG